MKNRLTCHHLLSKFSGWSNKDINKALIRQTRHRAIHTLYWPANPIEQLEMNLHINSQILKEEFINNVLEVLEYDNPEYIYKDWVYIPRKYKQHTR